MRKTIITLLITSLCIFSLTACGKANEATTDTITNDMPESTELSDATKDALDNLYSIQANYASGVAPLIEIPPAYCEELYNNYDAISKANTTQAPIQLREYAATDTVYFDYDDDYSVVWDKKNNSVTVQQTDIEEREEFKQKQHK